MNVLAGFDLVIEVSRETVLELVKANVQIGGESINPPFEIFVPIATPAGNGLGHIIVHQVDLLLSGDRNVTLGFSFHNSSVIFEPPLSITTSLLDGMMAVTATLDLIDPKPLRKAVSADLSAATVNLQFSDAAEARIAAALAGKPLDPTAFKSLAREKAESYVRSVGRQTLPLEFQVEPGNFGSISAAIFERLELHNILAPPSGMFFDIKQAVGLFGMLLPGVPSGDHSQKDGPVILPGHQLAVSISARAFHRLVFCPGLGAPNNLSVPELPPSCGSGGGIDRDGVKLTSISDTFADGKVDVNGTVEKSGTCYDASGSFHAAVTFSVVAGQLVANTAIDPPFIYVDVPWYCELVTAVLGPIGLIISAIVSSSMDDAMDEMKAMMNGLTGKGFTFGTSGFGTAHFDDVAVSPEGLTLHGFAPTITLPYPQKPAIAIEGSVVTDALVGGIQGTYTVEGGCLEGSYPYTETQQEQVGTFVAVPTLLGRPLELTWRVEGLKGYFSKWGPIVALDTGLHGTGTKVVHGVDTHYPVPLPDGADVVQNVHVAYKVGKSLITLKNTPSEGCFGLKLSVIATDPLGQVESGITGVHFDGDVVQIGGGYQEKLAECIRFWIGVAESYKLQDRVPRWVPVNYPPEAQLVELIRYLFSVDIPEVQELLPHVRLAHGTSYTRALLSREAAGPIGIKGRPQR